MKLDIQATPVFQRNFDAYYDPKYRYLINQGGSRSSKSVSIIQLLIIICLKEKTSVSVVRQSFPSLRSSIMRDFFEMLKTLKIYDEKSHQKTEHLYTFKNGSTVEFFSTDSEQKIRGRKRDVLFLNEGNEISLEILNQLVLRTSGKVLIDFNPSDTDHWIYDLIKQENTILIKSTYKDNPFLEQDQIDYIENLINVDQNYYKVYCLGERPTSNTRVYTHFKQYQDEVISPDFCYGCDLGFNHPSTLIKTVFVGEKVYCKEEIFQSGLTTSDIITKMNELKIDKNKYIYCDSARPEVIEEFRRAGYNARSSDKNVKQGIDKVKSMEVYVHYESVNIWKEFRSYSWKSEGEKILDEVIKLNDDSMDAIRYAIYTHHKNSGKFNYEFEFISL